MKADLKSLAVPVESQKSPQIGVQALLNASWLSTETTRHVQTLAKELFSQTRLSVFEFARVYDSGEVVILHSNPAIAQYVIQNQVHVTAHIPSSVLTEKFWYLPDPRGQYSRLIHAIHQLSGASIFADFIIRNVGYFDMFCFMSNLGLDGGLSHLVNMKEKCEVFSYQFLDRAGDLIHSAAQAPVKLPETMKPNFKGLTRRLEPFSSSGGEIEQHFDLLQQRVRHQISSSSQSLFTRRELECIQLLFSGCTAAQMGERLNLSKRTIETHLDHIKEKLHCSKKSQIIDRFMSSQSA